MIDAPEKTAEAAETGTLGRPTLPDLIRFLEQLAANALEDFVTFLIAEVFFRFGPGQLTPPVRWRSRSLHCMADGVNEVRHRALLEE